jgi:flagellar protein FlaG
MAIEATAGLAAALLPTPGAIPNPGQNSGLPHSNTAGGGAVRRQDTVQQYPRLAEAARAEMKRDAAPQPDRLKEATQMLNDFLKHYAIALEFKVDDGQTVVKVMNKQTGDLIRQVPSEEAIRLSKALDTLQGMIIQQKV